MNNNSKLVQIAVSISIVCMVLGFFTTIQIKNVKKNAEKESVSGMRMAELQATYQKEKEKNDALYKEYVKVQQDLEKYIAAIEDTNTTTKLLKEQLDSAEIMAGMKEVTGQGVTVKMSDGSKTSAIPGQEGLYWIHDGDLLMVINELRDAGAEAISLNDQRLTSLSEVRCVGAVVSVNNVRVGEPFIIKAIGEAKTLESALMFKGGIISELTTYKIECEVKTSENITIPAYKGAVNFKYAAVPTPQPGGAQ